MTYLEQILGNKGKALHVVTHTLQVCILIQHSVVDVQEELEGILIKEVHLQKGKDMILNFVQPKSDLDCGNVDQSPRQTNRTMNVSMNNLVTGNLSATVNINL